MIKTRLQQTILSILIGAAVLLLAACGADVSPVGVTALPPAEVTVTAGGMALLAFASPAPPTATPEPAEVPQSSTPAYLLTALPAGADFAECPQPGAPAPPPAPPTYNLYATTINQFLSDGGMAPFLQAVLQEWGALTETSGLVTDAYDLTGDGVFETIVVAGDPYNVTVSPQPGQLLVFACHEGGYRLLYASDYGPGYGMPTILHVGDINADVQPELVFFQERCQSGSCVQSAQVLTWKPLQEGFVTLNVDTVGATDGRFSIVDLDGDNVQEIMIQGGGISSDASAGPPRSSTTVWDWNGLNYVRALTRLDPPLYRIHAIHDGDQFLAAGDTQEAARMYREALENPRLGTWNVPNEQVLLRGYAWFKLIVAYVLEGQTSAAQDALTRLNEENPDELTSNLFVPIANAFWGRYQSTGVLHDACIAAAEMMALNPESVLFLNSYGPANPIYQIPDVCPF